MKKLYVLAGVLLLAVMLTSVGIAAAEVAYYPSLEAKAKGIIWYFSTDVDGDGVADFNGNNVIRCSIVAEWWDDDANGGTLHPLLILTTKNYVMLVFLPWSLPDLATGNQVTGTLRNGEEFLASGPGFTFRTK
jgi:hypothetical protein